MRSVVKNSWKIDIPPPAGRYDRTSYTSCANKCRMGTGIILQDCNKVRPAALGEGHFPITKIRFRPGGARQRRHLSLSLGKVPAGSKMSPLGSLVCSGKLSSTGHRSPCLGRKACTSAESKVHMFNCHRPALLCATPDPLVEPTQLTVFRSKHGVHPRPGSQKGEGAFPQGAHGGGVDGEGSAQTS